MLIQFYGYIYFYINAFNRMLSNSLRFLLFLSFCPFSSSGPLTFRVYWVMGCLAVALWQTFGFLIVRRQRSSALYRRNCMRRYRNCLRCLGVLVRSWKRFQEHPLSPFCWQTLRLLERALAVVAQPASLSLSQQEQCS